MKRCMALLLLALLVSVAGAKAGDWDPINPPNLPSERHGHSLVTLPNGELSLFGGRGPQGDVKNDLHMYGNTGWRQVVPINEAPPARYNHSAWVQSGQMYINGGRGVNGALDDMWRYDPVNNSWEEVQFVGSKPPARHGHTVTPLSDGSRLVLAGTDANGALLDDFWRIYPDGTTQRLANCPRYYTDHITKTIDNEKLVLVFGEPGSMAMYQFSNDMWGMISGGPPVKGYAASVEGQNDLGEPVLFIFGGEDASGNESNVVYVFNLATGELTTRTEPMPQAVKDGAVAILPQADQASHSRDILPNGLLDGRTADAAGEAGLPVMFFGGISNGAVTDFTAMFYPNSLSYVCSDGYCGGRTPCNKTIQAAIDAAATGTLIKIAAEEHNGNFSLSANKALTIQGGWDKTFNNPNGGTTTLKGAPKAPQGSLTIQNLKIVP